jgi:orotidine-5'-phosphate decarboxylase
MGFGERLKEAVERTGTCACVGLDPHLDKFPEELKASWHGLEGTAFRNAAAAAVQRFNREVLTRIAGKVPAVKPQLAFYEELGAAGWAALEETCRLARDLGILVVADAKRGDIQSTAQAYAQAILSDDGPLAADAMTVSPWLGGDTIEPYLPLVQRQGKGLFVLVRTTNPGSALLQHHGQPRAANVAAREVHRLGLPSAEASGLSAVGAVVGAQTSPDEVRALREEMPHAWFLVPGYGAQGGRRDDCFRGRRTDGLGVLVAASRSVLFPPAEGDPWAAVERAVASFARDVAL